MKRILLAASLLVMTTTVTAQWVVTNPISDVLTQLQHAAKYALAAEAYSQQILQYKNQLLQYETQLKNLKEHSMGGISPDLNLLVSNAARLTATGQSIANGMSTVSGNISKAFVNSKGDFGTKFKIWTDTSSDALKGSMLNAGLHRENFDSDTAALQALVEKNAASGGALAATKTLGEINNAQLMESIKLREMISGQQLAVSTYMMSQAAKEQAMVDNSAEIQKGFNEAKATVPALDTKARTYKKFDMFTK